MVVVALALVLVCVGVPASAAPKNDPTVNDWDGANADATKIGKKRVMAIPEPSALLFVSLGLGSGAVGLRLLRNRRGGAQ